MKITFIKRVPPLIADAGVANLQTCKPACCLFGHTGTLLPWPYFCLSALLSKICRFAVWVLGYREVPPLPRRAVEGLERAGGIGISPKEKIFKLEMEPLKQQNEALGRQLWDAADAGNAERVTELLDQGVAVDFRVYSWTPLIRASKNGYSEVVTLLLDRGPDLNAVTEGGRSALIESAENGYLGIVQMLAARGANIHHKTDRGGFSALLRAAFLDHLPVCEFLLSRGADLMAANNNGWAALTHYGQHAHPRPSAADKALRCAALEAAWAVGPHPSQVQRRKGECWESCKPFVFFPVT